MLLTLENVMKIFVAYNQKNIQQGVNWDTWPDWELCLTAMSFEVAIESEDDSDSLRFPFNSAYFLNFSK